MFKRKLTMLYASCNSCAVARRTVWSMTGQYPHGRSPCAQQHHLRHCCGQPARRREMGALPGLSSGFSCRPPMPAPQNEPVHTYASAR